MTTAKESPPDEGMQAETLEESGPMGRRAGGTRRAMHPVFAQPEVVALLEVLLHSAFVYRRAVGGQEMSQHPKTNNIRAIH